MMPSWMRKLSCFTLLTLVLAGCDSSVDHHLEAVQAFESDNYEDSLIHLKLALKSDPSNAELRKLLGEVWFHLGDMQACVHQLKKAQALGYDHNQLILPLARCYLYQKDFDSLENLHYQDQLIQVSSKNMAQFYAYKALGEIQQEHFNTALDFIDQARVLQVDEPLVKLTYAQWLAYQKNQDDALELLDDILENHPNYAQAWGMRADIYRLRGNKLEAIKAYSQALIYSKHKLDLLHYHTYRGLTQLYREDIQAAKNDIQWLERHFPKSASLYYLNGLMALNQHQYTQAIEAFHSALQSDPTLNYADYFIGLSYFQAGSYLQARDHLVRYAHTAPNHLQGQQLLALTEVKLKDHHQASLRLKQLVTKYPNDAHLNQMYADVLVKAGNIKQGERYLANSVTQEPENLQNTYKFGIAQMDLGDVENARWAFDKVLEKLPNSKEAFLLKFFNEFRAQHFVLALNLSHAYQEQNPKDPLGFNLEGMVYAAQAHKEEAEQAFSQALNLDPHDPNANTQLAIMAMKANDVDKAKHHYQTILKRYPHVPSMLKYAKVLLAYDKDPHSAKTLLEKAIKTNPRELSAYLALTRFWMQENKLDQAQKVLHQAPQELKTNPLYLAMDGLLLLRGEQSYTARQNWLLINQQQSVPLNSPLIIEFGLTLAQTLNDWQLMVNFASKLYERWPSSQSVALNAQILWLTNKPSKALTLLETWLQKHPTDTSSRIWLANYMMRSERFEHAQVQYRAVLAQEPEHLLALNNLAWLLRESNPEEALSYAQKALVVKPGWAAAQNTLNAIEVNLQAKNLSSTRTG